MNTFEKLVEDTKNSIIDTIDREGIYRHSSCDAPNWDKDSHEAHKTLQRRGINGLFISSKINFEVTDWVITKY